MKKLYGVEVPDWFETSIYSIENGDGVDFRKKVYEPNKKLRRIKETIFNDFDSLDTLLKCVEEHGYKDKPHLVGFDFTSDGDGGIEKEIEFWEEYPNANYSKELKKYNDYLKKVEEAKPYREAVLKAYREQEEKKKKATTKRLYMELKKQFEGGCNDDCENCEEPVEDCKEVKRIIKRRAKEIQK